ncbi:MAG: hypothetical protein ACI8X5_003297 [Planctomycetota bacterium]|jgi:hypothetical protein
MMFLRYGDRALQLPDGGECRVGSSSRRIGVTIGCSLVAQYQVLRKRMNRSQTLTDRTQSKKKIAASRSSRLAANFVAVDKYR